MKPYFRTMLVVALIFVLVLSGCALPASQPPKKATATTSANEPPFPVNTEDTSIAGFATQTAQAAQPSPGNEQTTETPVVVVATETPAAGGAQNPAGGGQQAPEATATPQPSGNQGGNTSGNQSGGGNTSTGSNQSSNQPATVNTPVITRPASYTLKQGEWPICIARRYNLDLSSFFSVNNLNMNSKPNAGTTLQIPASGNWGSQYGPRALKNHPTKVTVGAGQSVYSIACDFGDVAPESILAVNGLGSAGDVKTGMTLTIP